VDWKELKRNFGIAKSLTAMLVIIIVLVGVWAVTLIRYNVSSTTETITATPSTETITATASTVTSSLTTTLTVTLTQKVFDMNTTVLPDQVISFWEACGSYCINNNGSLPADVSVVLGLYEFYIVGHIAGGYNFTIIPVNMTTGLPEKPIVEPFPDGVVVDVNVQGIEATSCVMYMLIWAVSAPSNIPYGGDSSVSALTGDGLDLKGVSLGLTCPPANITVTTFSYLLLRIALLHESEGLMFLPP